MRSSLPRLPRKYAERPSKPNVRPSAGPASCGALVPSARSPGSAGPGGPASASSEPPSRGASIGPPSSPLSRPPSGEASVGEARPQQQRGERLARARGVGGAARAGDQRRAVGRHRDRHLLAVGRDQAKRRAPARPCVGAAAHLGGDLAAVGEDAGEEDEPPARAHPQVGAGRGVREGRGLEPAFQATAREEPGLAFGLGVDDLVVAIDVEHGAARLHRGGGGRAAHLHLERGLRRDEPFGAAREGGGVPHHRLEDPLGAEVPRGGAAQAPRAHGGRRGRRPGGAGVVAGEERLGEGQREDLAAVGDEIEDARPRGRLGAGAPAALRAPAEELALQRGGEHLGADAGDLGERLGRGRRAAEGPQRLGRLVERAALADVDPRAVGAIG